MTHKQFKHPLTLLGLAFMVLGGIAARFNEYSLPAYARKLDASVLAMTSGYQQQFISPTPLVDNHLSLKYKEAHEILISRSQFDNSYDGLLKNKNLNVWLIGDSNKDNALVLPRPSDPFPESLAREIASFVGERRYALDLLHQVARDAQSQWFLCNMGADDSGLFSSYVKPVLLLEALHHVIQRDEAGVLRALYTLKTLHSAWENISPRFGWYAFPLLRGSLYILLDYGIETGLFSNEGLDSIASSLMCDDDFAAKALIQVKWDAQTRTNRYGTLYQNYTIDGLYVADGTRALEESLFWFEERISSRYSMKEMLFYGIRIDQLCSLWEIGINEDIDALHNYMNQAEYTGGLRTLSSHPYDVSFLFPNTDVISLLSNNLFYGFRVQWQCRLLQTIIALEKHRRQTGSFPDSLGRLEPSVLPEGLCTGILKRIDYRRTADGWEIVPPVQITLRGSKWDKDLLFQYPLKTP